MKTNQHPNPPQPRKKIFIGPGATDQDIMAAVMELNLVSNAKALAEEAHKGEFRNDGRTPYIVHARRVVGWLLKSGASEPVIAAAWLHDVLEHGKVTEADLKRAGIPPLVIEAVVALSKRPGESYRDYLARVEANPIARRVKVADMIDNLADEPSPRAMRRYQHGLARLISDAQSHRKTVGFFKVPEDSKERAAFVNSIVDQMERVEKKQAAAGRAAKKGKARKAK